MNSLSKEQITKLNKQFPKSAYSKDPSRGFELTSIDAYYIIELLNDVFGLCGSGWGLNVKEYVKSDNEITALAELWYMNGEEMSIIDCEGGKRIIKENITDAYKSARTNAICKGASFLGVGMDVYKGEFNGVKEQKTPEKDISPSGETKPDSETKPNNVKIDILKDIKKILNDNWKTREERMEICKSVFDTDDWDTIKGRTGFELSIGLSAIKDKIPKPISTDGTIEKPKGPFGQKLKDVGKLKQTFIDLDKLSDYESILGENFHVKHANEIRKVNELSKFMNLLSKRLKEYDEQTNNDLKQKMSRKIKKDIAEYGN